MQKIPQNTHLNFLTDGGEMGAMIRAYDWQKTPLGAPETWPQPLKTTLRVLLSTGHPMLIFWGPDLIQFYNDPYALTLGSERHPSALGQTAQACWGEIWPDIEPQIIQVMTGNGYTWNENQPLAITRNGKRENLYWTFSYSPIDDPQTETGVGGVLVVCSETTKQVHSEQNMKSAEARWRALFDQAPSFMCILAGPEHRFEYANRNYYAMLGSLDILGKTVMEAIPELANQGYLELLDKVYQTGVSHQGVASPLSIGSEDPKFLDFIYQPILTPEGQVIGILVDGYDVTERVLANKALIEEDRRKDEFLAMLAHELRNPLAPIRNVSEMLSLRASQDSQDSQLQNIGSILARQVSHLAHLTDDLLDVSRISQNRIDLQMKTLNASNIVNLVLESLDSTIALKQHQVRFMDSEKPVFVLGDLTRLVQCLSNILSNAIKYTPIGGNIDIHLDATDDCVVITVTDNGCGLDQEILPEVFDLFVQAKQTLDRSQGGLGIGLNIVQRLVKMHGGSVKVSSDGLGLGASFSITLPTTKAPIVLENKKLPATQNVRKRVLVVDDNEDSADTMAELLKLQGHKVATAYTAQNALEYVDSFDPQIILLDIGLPDMDGYQVAQCIRSNNSERMLVALTGYGQADDIRRAKEVGFNFHFTKPVDFKDLTHVINTPEPYAQPS